jgi:hypothetical protein
MRTAQTEWTPPRRSVSNLVVRVRISRMSRIASAVWGQNGHATGANAEDVVGTEETRLRRKSAKGTPRLRSPHARRVPRPSWIEILGRAP